MKSFLIGVFITFGIFAMANGIITVYEVKSVFHQIYICLSIIIALLSWILAAIVNIDLNFVMEEEESI